MPTTTLAERAKEVRLLLGYERQKDFAKLLGISAPSLSAIESGETLSLGDSLLGFYRVGANLLYLTEGKGEPMRSGEIERKLKDDTLASMMGELDESEKDMVADVVKGIIRRKKGGSANDPFKKDPPKDGTQ